MTVQFPFEVSDEDNSMLSRLRERGFSVRLSLSPQTGGIDVSKDGQGLQWSFVSEIDGTNGLVHATAKEAVEALLDDHL